jgi:hypothetical protein
VEETETTFEWFKLMLDYKALPPAIKSSRRVQQIHNKLRDWYEGDPSKAAVKVTAHNLQFLWLHAIKVIVNKEGQSWVEGMPCKVVITRPAIWSQKASTETQRAAEWAISSRHHR